MVTPAHVTMSKMASMNTECRTRSRVEQDGNRQWLTYTCTPVSYKIKAGKTKACKKVEKGWNMFLTAVD